MSSRDEIREIANEAAEQTIKKLFLTLGVDISDPDAILATQRDFQHMRVWRESSDAIKRHSLKTIVTVLVTGLLGYALVAFGFKVPG